MYSSDFGKKGVVLKICPQNDPEFDKRIRKVKELTEELNDAIRDLMMYEHEVLLTCKFGHPNTEDDEN